MFDQVKLRARIAGLEERQEARIVQAEKMKLELDRVLAVRQREIDNLKTRLFKVVK